MKHLESLKLSEACKSRGYRQVSRQKSRKLQEQMKQALEQQALVLPRLQMRVLSWIKPRKTDLKKN
jgi:hypothetical protein